MAYADVGPYDLNFTDSYELDMYKYAPHNYMIGAYVKSKSFVFTSDYRSGSGQLVVVTKVDNIIAPGILVALYFRPTLKLVTIKTSDASGTIVFDNLYEGESSYFTVALTELNFNAIVADKLTAEGQ